MIKIREANIGDIDTIKRFITKLAEYESRLTNCLEPDYESIEKIDNELENPKITYLVAEANGKIVGILKLKQIRRDTGKIAEAYVLTRWRRKGVMSALYNRIEEIARDKDLSKLILTVTKNNERAHKFWKKKGFKKVAYEECLDRMAKWL